MAKRKTKRKRSKPVRKESAYTRSLYRHGDPANFALHIVAIPFLILGLITQRLEIIAIGAFYIIAGALYAYFGAQEMKQIWVTLFDNNVNKWFSFVSLILFAVGLWHFDLVSLLMGLTIFLFGLLYAVIVEY